MPRRRRISRRIALWLNALVLVAAPVALVVMTRNAAGGLLVLLVLAAASLWIRQGTKCRRCGHHLFGHRRVRAWPEGVCTRCGTIQHA
jgi:hypothetical protein